MAAAAQAAAGTNADTDAAVIRASLADPDRFAGDLRPRYPGHNIFAAAFDPAGATVVRSPDIAKGTAELRLGPKPKPGDVIYKSALLRIAIVDKAGERP
ncbi:hypothetical protein ACFQS1_39390 [Paractinoplanes rhizophilus]|uniref:Uncharacterized protein n=1 Tax=Paractinoplanes rhizophilus TaxID=1416877 RepID=A0ABW2I5H5_9ACTN